MKLKKSTIIFKYLKQLLLLVGLLYAFSNCHVKKSVLHLAGIKSVQLSQKSLTQLPVQGSCHFSILQKSSLSKSNGATAQVPIIPNRCSFYFQIHENHLVNTSPIHPAFKFNKGLMSFPPMFIVFKKIKIAPAVVSYTA